MATRKPGKNPLPAASTALARVPKQTLELRIHDPSSMLPAPAAPEHALTEDAILGALGLTDLKLKKREERILNEPVLEAEVQMKPSGQPYLSHPAYTKWFNRAFGRLGWALVARTRPLKQDKSVVCGYILYIHGQPAAFAYGEQEYHESNAEQTYGDALEATVASALRRCAKRLGVGLELWDRQWLNSFIERECVAVWCNVKGQNKKLWRKKSDRPFWNEIGGKPPKGDEPMQETTTTRARPPAGQDGTDELPITNIPKNKDGKVGQVQRLWIIVKNSGRKVDDVKLWLERAYGYTSSKDIKRKHYEAICEAIESSKPLFRPDREPGEDD